jgi:hypothetical protein
MRERRHSLSDSGRKIKGKRDREREEGGRR